MAEKTELICVSCKRKITNKYGIARFMCPKCGKFEIIRCLNCREIVAKYTCPVCGFVGPN
ncbi:MAG: zinc finger domain-containing protein [Candidatus Woesearchaeota archaeon]|nr:zinc finger domain-containing protein [Candidatus Woesearchaeota archaeon]